MKRLGLIAAVALVMSVWAGIAPQSVHAQGCSAFGAQGRPLAGELGDLVSAVATSGPGALAAVVAAEHDALCD